MSFDDTVVEPTVRLLSQAFLQNYPLQARQTLETMPPAQAAEVLAEMPAHVVEAVWQYLAPATAEMIFAEFDGETAWRLLENFEPQTSAALLSRVDANTCAVMLARVDASVAAEIRTLLDYPDQSVGRLMDSRVLAFHDDLTVGGVIDKLRALDLQTFNHLYLLDEQNRLRGQLDLSQLLLADESVPLLQLMQPLRYVANVLDPRDEMLERLEGAHVEAVPVIDANTRLVGVVHANKLFDSIREDLVTDLQTMVGVSKDERALSSSWFAVRKRLPWLQINLVTAFLAASVVGAFESTIAQFTALAVLMPVAAGQAGNAGAQALAVTMRGLTLREITVRQWIRVMLKEMGTGLINGIAIAITCAVAVYLWSGSTGLALVMALALVISLVIAGIAGALVPIVLRKLGQDPAQSSSIVLTTVTDISGFLSFLGIATLMSGMLG